MHFLAAALATLSAVSALTTPNRSTGVLKRQVAEGTGCAFVDVSLPRTVDELCLTPQLDGRCDIVVTPVLTTVLGNLAVLADPLISLCLCTELGALTPTNIATLRTQLALRSTLIGAANTLLATVLLDEIDLAAILAPLAADLVVEQTDGCDYPDNADPICNGEDSCAFECRDDFFLCEAGPSPVCLADGDTCGSASFGRRRRRQISNKLLCSAGRSACALPGNKFGFECLDTQADVESCGGCAFPLPGAAKGRDCTAITNVADVSCVNGACVVESCLQGHVSVGGACVHQSTLGGIVDEATGAVGGLAALVGKLVV